jgi:hypothetical protein
MHYLVLVLMALYFGSWLLYSTFLVLLIAAFVGTTLSQHWDLLLLPLLLVVVPSLVLSVIFYGVKDTLTVVFEQYVPKAWKRFLWASIIGGMLVFVTNNSNKHRHDPERVVEYHHRSVCAVSGFGVALLGFVLVHLQGMLSFKRLTL